MFKHNKLKTGISRGEKKVLALATGKKKAKTEEDKKILKEIDDIKVKGRQLHIPHD
jgi:hypothetical protein